MFRNKWMLLFCAALLLGSSAWAQTTYWGGFEDTPGNGTNGSGSDYDYNDMVFSISGTSLTLISSGSWYTEPTLYVGNGTAQGLVGTPYWNNSSSDGVKDNIGWCIYGGGTCNGGVGLDPGALYLASNPSTTTGSADDVEFSVSGNVSETVTLSITANSDELGWEALSGVNKGVENFFTAGAQGPTSFTPGGDFILIGKDTSTSKTFSSDPSGAGGCGGSCNYGLTDTENGVDVSHFAFFDSAPTPEPGGMVLLGTLLMAAGILSRKKSQKA